MVCYNIHDYYLAYCPSATWFTISKIIAECADLVVCCNQSILQECNRDFLLMNSIKLKCLYPWYGGHAVHVQWIARHTHCKQVLIPKYDLWLNNFSQQVIYFTLHCCFIVGLNWCIKLFNLSVCIFSIGVYTECPISTVYSRI